ncbi:MAG: hypothetical protein KDA93_25325 [Planctomycetaceae bacterium]|nr:hypothetical protein [Planctomycetaceae bacterium]
MRQHLTLLATTLMFVALVGCDTADSSATNVHPQSAAVRASRRAFAGAPPVIPHPPLTGTCNSCHTPDGGRVIPTIGIAPANPHTQTRGMSAVSRCKQCHVFNQTDDMFVDTEFVALSASRPKADRAHISAPPVNPHELFMREDCNACHSGPAARPEISCQHSERIRCQQCHVQHVNHRSTAFVQTEPSTSGNAH